MKKSIVSSISVLALSLILFGCGSSNDADSSSSKTQQTTKSHATTDKEKGTDKAESTKEEEKTEKEKAGKTLELDDETYKLSDVKTFNVGYEDANWSAAKVNVDKVEINTLEEPTEYETLDEDKIEIKGFARIHMSVTPSRDIDFYPTQGTIVAGSEQEEATEAESWDGEINNGVDQDGWISFPLKNVDDIDSIRFKFDADYEQDDDDEDYDENSDHEYDMTLNLN